MKKRPHDINALAAAIVAQATDEDREPEDPYEGKNPAAVELGRQGGLKGGPARMAKLTPEQRSELAYKAAAARWRFHEKPLPSPARRVGVPRPPATSKRKAAAVIVRCVYCGHEASVTDAGGQWICVDGTLAFVRRDRHGQRGWRCIPECKAIEEEGP